MPGDDEITRPRVPELRPGISLDAEGRYEILEQLGSGGMGRVYLARRSDGEYRQTVAIKVLRWSRGSDESARARFRIERQILADLDHPNIARLLDGGTTPDGLPFLVMEYVEGASIEEYCATCSASTDERLDLVHSMCGALDFAHRRLVVHRDIKPSNIMVSPTGVPKLLDFGIAKLLDPELALEMPAQTLADTQPMTPRYASPEQARGEPITVATDVYSLGVVLYELLTGEPPYRPAGTSPYGWMKVICDQQPRKPSAVGRGEKGRSSANLNRHLRGDLDAIVLKALHKEPAERYTSASALADDLSRYRRGLPIGARPATILYRFRKFARRSPMVVIAAATVVALGIGWTASLSLQLERTARERDRASRERARSQQVVTFLVDLFEIADPDESRGNDIRAREILDRGATRIAKELAGQTDIQATMKETIGVVYENLGLFAEATQLLEEAVATRRTSGTAEDLAGSLSRLATLKLDTAEYDRAEELLAEELELRDRLGHRASVAVAELLNKLGVLRDIQGATLEADRHYRRSLELHRRFGGSSSSQVGTVLIHLAINLHGRGEYEEAEELCREALFIHRSNHDGDHSDVGQALGNLASILHARNEFEEAESLYRESLDMRRRLLGDEHPLIGLMANNLGSLMLWRGDLDGAGPLLEEALEIIRSAHGEDHRLTSFPYFNLGQLHLLRNDPVSAEPHLRRSFEISSALFDQDHREVGLSMAGLGSALCLLGRNEEGERSIRTGLATLERTDADPWRLAQSRSWLGVCLEASSGRRAEARKLLEAALPTLEGKFGAEHPLSDHTRKVLTSLREAG